MKKPKNKIIDFRKLGKLNKVMIEPTNLCNLRCAGRPNGAGFFEDKPRGIMNFRQFKKIIDLNESLNQIDLWGIGEPFLAPNIIKMIDYVGRNNIFVSVHTNANAFNKKMLSQFKDIRTRLSVTFSIDGISQKTYGYYRKGGNLRKAMDNLCYLINLKEKYNLSNIRIIWQFLVMKINEHEIPEIYKIANRIKVDKLKLKTINIDPRSGRCDDFKPKRYLKYLEKENKGWEKGESYKIIKKSKCEYIDPGSVFILWDGEVVPCCYDYGRSYVMGNAFEKSLVSIWNSAKYRKFRENYKKGENNLCDTCRFKRRVDIYERKTN